MKNISVLQISNLVALIATLIMNALAASSDLFGQSMADVGESRAIFFLPSGYVFAIWGVIYILVIGFTIYQFRPVSKENGTQDAVGWWFVVSSVANIVWLFLFMLDQVWLSTVAMLVLLGSLLMIYQNLKIGQESVDWQQKWAAHVPFSVYLGWISVATVANFSAALYESGNVTSFLGIGADIWAVVMMIVAGILGITMLFRRYDIAYALVIMWALYGINARPFDTDTFSVLADLNASLVNQGALAITVIVGLAVLVRVGMQLQQGQKAA